MPERVIVTREIAPFPHRAADAHKGDAGRVVVIGGCAGETMMVGAVALAANAALRTGCGLAQALVPESLRPPLAVLAPCATMRALPNDAVAVLKAIADFQADAVALGPGLGDSLSPETLAAVLQQCDRPMVVDADALNQLSRAAPFKLPPGNRVVFTPHVGEALALSLVDGWGGVFVLKGAGTVVTDGRRLYVNATGNPGMATAGTGDVLTGMIASLLAQGLEALEGAILGTYLHGLAGDFAAEEMGRRSLIATDLIDYIPEALSEHELSNTD
jgi:hydroxyethylthiazole kinase-like uncharacterized protein yjeF